MVLQTPTAYFNSKTYVGSKANLTFFFCLFFFLNIYKYLTNFKRKFSSSQEKSSFLF